MPFLVFLAAFCSALTTARPSAGCGVTPQQSLGKAHLHHINTRDGQRRQFRSRLPLNYDENKPTVLVIDIHGYTSSSYQQAQNSGFEGVADELNFVAVWPDGSNDDEGPNFPAGWNALGATASHSEEFGPTCYPDRRAWGHYNCYDSCGNCDVPGTNFTSTCSAGSCHDDVAFIKAMLDVVEASICIDLDHVHCSGLSMGSMMCYEIAHSLSSRIASIAPVAGLPMLGFLDRAVPVKSPVSLLDLHGLIDGVIPANLSNVIGCNAGGPHGSTLSNDGFFYTPLLNVTRAWGGVNGCPGTSSGGAVEQAKTSLDGDRHWYCRFPEGKTCASGAEIVTCSGLFEHTWPWFDGDETTETFARFAFDFMKAHPKVHSPDI